MSQLGLQDATSPEQLISKLCDQLGIDAPKHETASDLIQDLVIGDADEKGGRQFRVAWSTSDTITTAFVAVRNPPEPPVLPENPRAVLNEWCGADSVILLRCDQDEVIVSTEGSLQMIGADSESELRGLTTDSVLGQLMARFGEMEITPGPSGSSTDSMVAFRGGAAREGLQLRVVVERLEDSVVVYIGRQGLEES